MFVTTRRCRRSTSSVLGSIKLVLLGTSPGSLTNSNSGMGNWPSMARTSFSKFEPGIKRRMWRTRCRCWSARIIPSFILWCDAVIFIDIIENHGNAGRIWEHVCYMPAICINMPNVKIGRRVGAENKVSPSSTNLRERVLAAFVVARISLVQELVIDIVYTRRSRLRVEAKEIKYVEERIVIKDMNRRSMMRSIARKPAIDHSHDNEQSKRERT